MGTEGEGQRLGGVWSVGEGGRCVCVNFCGGRKGVVEGRVGSSVGDECVYVKDWRREGIRVCVDAYMRF